MYRTDLKGVEIGSSASKTCKLCILGALICRRTVAHLDCNPAIYARICSIRGRITAKQTVCVVYNNYMFFSTSTRLLSLLTVSVPQATHFDLSAICKNGCLLRWKEVSHAAQEVESPQEA